MITLIDLFFVYNKSINNKEEDISTNSFLEEFLVEPGGHRKAQTQISEEVCVSKSHSNRWPKCLPALRELHPAKPEGLIAVAVFVKLWRIPTIGGSQLKWVLPDMDNSWNNPTS